MKKSKKEAAETRQRIVKTAAAGLTHGGFYRHFDSKDQLVAESCAAAVDSVVESFTSALSRKTKRSGLEAVAASYLSKEHRDNSSGCCPFVALGSELVRGSPRGSAVYL
jgi:TetR/AcrR family transcriptional regulator, transcriptional repressor for nem operon